MPWAPIATRSLVPESILPTTLSTRLHRDPESRMGMDSGFVSTRWSMVAKAGGDDPATSHAALTWLIERYWDPLRQFACRKGCDAHAAEDAVQDFCCRMLERRCDLAAVSPLGGRFRSWLLVVFRNFLLDLLDQKNAAKRGGGRSPVDLQMADAITAKTDDSDFNHDWAIALLDRAINRLAAEQSNAAADKRYAQLSPFLMANGSSAAYTAAGRTLGLGEGAVKVAVHRLRQRLRELVRLEIRETIADPSREEIEAEMETLAKTLAKHRA